MTVAKVTGAVGASYDPHEFIGPSNEDAVIHKMTMHMALMTTRIHDLTIALENLLSYVRQLEFDLPSDHEAVKKARKLMEDKYGF